MGVNQEVSRKVPATETAETGARAEKGRILVVDDSRVIRRAISKTLAAEFELIEAEDGEAGWETLCRDERIQAVISDVEMPRLDGHGLLKRIRIANDPRLRAIPVIIITGAEDEAAKKAAYAAGATDFITKPIDAVQLLARAHAHVRLDTAARKLAESAVALEEKALIDPLTQLFNRRYFLDRGAEAVALAQRRRSDLSVLRLDIDGFKEVFAQHGDGVADAVLVRLAQLLAKKTRREETAARIGGAEFAVLAPLANRVEAMVLGERLRAGVETEVFAQGGARVPLSISVGIATLTEGTDMDGLLALAQKRLNIARNAGGNRVNVGQITETPRLAVAGAVMPDAAPNAASATPAPKAALAAAPGVDMALKMLAKGEEDALAPHLPALTQAILPLLEACNKTLGLGLSFAIESLKEKLQQQT